MISRRAALAALIVSAAGCVHYGAHVILAGLRPLSPCETFILTLQFEHSGGIGVVTVVE